MTANRAIRGGLLFALASIMACALTLAVVQMLAGPVRDGSQGNLEAAYRYIDHMALNSARNALHRVRSIAGSDIGEDAEALIVALEVLRRTGSGEHLERLADGRRDETSVQIALGRLETSRGSVGKARDHFRRAVGKSPGNAAARLELGEALIRSGEVDEGMRNLQIAFEDRGKFNYISWRFAKALLVRNRVADAVRVLDELVDSDTINLKYTLQYLLVASENSCDSRYVRRLREAIRYFGNDLTMSLGDNDNAWELVVEGRRVTLDDPQSKRDVLADLQRRHEEMRCDG